MVFKHGHHLSPIDSSWFFFKSVDYTYSIFRSSNVNCKMLINQLMYSNICYRWRLFDHFCISELKTTTNLLIYCRLLYSLACTPNFLRQLLVYIRSEKQTSLFASTDTFLIHLLTKGVNLTHEEVQRIVPTLDVFCSLFSHLLVMMDDSEFFNDSGSTYTYIYIKVSLKIN